MGYLDPIIPAIPALVLGFSIVTYLTMKTERRHLVLAAVILFIFALGMAFYSIPWGTEMLIAVPLSAVMVVTGYVAGAFNLMALRAGNRPPAIGPVPDNPGDGHLAVIYVSPAEPENYYPHFWAELLRELDRNGVKSVSLLRRPLLFWHIRNQYLNDGSEDMKSHLRLMEQIEKRFREVGNGETVFYFAALRGVPSPEDVMVEAIDDGASRIIVIQALLTDSWRARTVREGMLRIRFPGTVLFTRPLWDSEKLRRGVVDGIEEKGGRSDKAMRALLFLKSGNHVDTEEPPEEEIQSQKFLELLFRDLTERGYETGKIMTLPLTAGRAVLEEELRKLSLKGAGTVICSALPFCGDWIYRLFGDLDSTDQAGINRIRILPSGAYMDHPMVVDALFERVIEQVEELKKVA